MNIKKCLLVFIFGLLLFGVTDSCFAAAPFNPIPAPNLEENINIVGSIFKTNEHGDGLVGAKFKISDINNTFYYYLEDEGNGLYGMGLVNSSNIEEVQRPSNTFNVIFDMLPRDVQNDLNQYISTGSTSHLNTAVYHVNSNSIYFPSILFIEEVTAPEGYARGEKIVLPVNGILNKHGNEYGLFLDILIETGKYLKYNKNVDYNNLVNYISSGAYFNDEVDCENLNFHSNALDNTGITYTPIILFNEKTNVSLTINNYVNNSNKYTTTRGNTLNYRVVVKNTGGGVSHDNVIVTTIPKELKYVAKSASDSGVYNKTNHTITWKVASIGAGKTLSFRYSAVVPKDVPVGANFIGKSTIGSKEIGEIQSRETTVSLINNPKTAAPIAVIVILASMMGVIRVIKDHNKEKELDV